jgi:hypothetical protein
MVTIEYEGVKHTFPDLAQETAERLYYLTESCRYAAVLLGIDMPAHSARPELAVAASNLVLAAELSRVADSFEFLNEHGLRS